MMKKMMMKRVRVMGWFVVWSFLIWQSLATGIMEETQKNITDDDGVRMEPEEVGNNTYVCVGYTDEEKRLYAVFFWWIDCLLQIITGLVGLAGNCLAIPILLSKKMSSIFNRILVCLAVFDNVFIICSIMEAIRKHVGPLHEVGHAYAFAYVLYELQSVAVVSSIFTTVVLALERCLAVAKPIEYHNAVQGTNPWRRVNSYIVPVIIFSTIFNIPKLFEIKVIPITTSEEPINDDLNSSEVEWNRTVYSVFPTDLRMDINYVFYYNNMAKLIITGIIPFFALCVFNFKIYSAMKRRRQTMGPAATAAHAQQLNEDHRQALVLFSIVIIFLLCNTPRVVLNFCETFNIKKYAEDLSHDCHSVPVWELIMGNLSQLMMIINSSINFFIYCFMSSVFRDVLRETISKICKSSGCIKLDLATRRHHRIIRSNPDHTRFEAVSCEQIPMIGKLNSSKKNDDDKDCDKDDTGHSKGPNGSQTVSEVAVV